MAVVTRAVAVVWYDVYMCQVLMQLSGCEIETTLLTIMDNRATKMRTPEPSRRKFSTHRSPLNPSLSVGSLPGHDDLWLEHENG